MTNGQMENILFVKEIRNGQMEKIVKEGNLNQKWTN